MWPWSWSRTLRGRRREYLRRIKREAEEAESLRMALEEERVAVAEKFAGLDKQAERQERERQTLFQQSLDTIIRDFEKRSRELAGDLFRIGQNA